MNWREEADLTLRKSIADKAYYLASRLERVIEPFKGNKFLSDEEMKIIACYEFKYGKEISETDEANMQKYLSEIMTSREIEEQKEMGHCYCALLKKIGRNKYCSSCEFKAFDQDKCADKMDVLNKGWREERRG